jgi:hypothetical protein
MPDQLKLYALKKLSEAVYKLATGPGDVRDRLYHASSDLLQIVPKSLPDELPHKLKTIMDDLKNNEGKSSPCTSDV